MAQEIAKFTSFCRVCGATIQAGKSLIRYAPAIKNSTRHAECFGKPDKFTAQGKSLDGLDDVVKPSYSPVGLPEEVNADWGGASEEGDTPPWEAQPGTELEQALQKSLDNVTGKPQDAPETKQVPAPPPADNKDVWGPLAAAIAPYLEDKLKGLVDEEKVKEIVKKQTEAGSAKQLVQEDKLKKLVEKVFEEKGTKTIQIEVKKPDGTVAKMEGLQHKNTPDLLKLILMRKNIYMFGPTGSGKSTAARKCAAAVCTEAHPNGLPYYYISLNPQSSPTRVEGYQTPHGEYVMTQFRKAYEFGGLFDAAEVDNSMANLWTSFNNAIDSDLGSFPDGMVKRHPDFVFVGNGNTNLSGDSVYRDRKALDKATIARFVFIEWPYDNALEKAITLARNNKAMPWLNWVLKLRDFAQKNNPSLYAYCHPRACYDGADLLANGFTVKQTADMVVFKNTFDETAVKAALTNCPLPKETMSL